MPRHVRCLLGGFLERLADIVHEFVEGQELLEFKHEKDLGRHWLWVRQWQELRDQAGTPALTWRIVRTARQNAEGFGAVGGEAVCCQERPLEGSACSLECFHACNGASVTSLMVTVAPYPCPCLHHFKTKPYQVSSAQNHGGL